VAFRTDIPKREVRSKQHLRQRRHHHNALLDPCEADLIPHNPYMHLNFRWVLFLGLISLAGERKGGWDDIFKEW
jgi:hypothetical protein